jgi:hypothetical protein
MKVIIILVLMFILGCSSMPEKDKNILVLNEILKENGNYSFSIKNQGLESCECSVKIKKTFNDKIEIIKEKDVGMIQIDQTINMSFNVGELPEGTITYEIIPICKKNG